MTAFYTCFVVFVCVFVSVFVFVFLEATFQQAGEAEAIHGRLGVQDFRRGSR